METEIKKVNNLEELSQLEPGERIHGRKPEQIDELVCENAKESPYEFIEAFVNDRKMIRSRVYHNINKIMFRNGCLICPDYELKVYYPGDKGYNSKLNLIQGEK